MLKIKLFAVLAVLVFASCAFLFSNNWTQQAQTGRTDVKRDPILDRIASYKLWKQPQKPEGNVDESSVILNSSAMG